MTPKRTLLSIFSLLLVLFTTNTSASAQANYEVQVYPADTVEPNATMIELHSNFTVDGSKTTTDGTLPTNHQLHETVEITHGFNKWFETGFYIFTSAQSGHGYQWVGDHIRPRVRVPEDWHWPVGVSLSTEFGYARPLFSADTWTWEIRPIIDKKLGPWYLAFNPSLEKSFRGPSQDLGYVFSPNAKISYDFSKAITVGLEYYGSLGPVGNFDPLREQEQQIVPSIDLNLSPKWEVNFGVGVGTTSSTDRLIVKGIVGYRFDKLSFRKQAHGKNSGNKSP
jgi:hypothetical protein